MENSIFDVTNRLKVSLNMACVMQTRKDTFCLFFFTATIFTIARSLYSLLKQEILKVNLSVLRYRAYRY